MAFSQFCNPLHAPFARNPWLPLVGIDGSRFSEWLALNSRNAWLRSSEQCSFWLGITIEIGESAFQDCIQLETVVLPSSIRIIENRAFENCRKLSDVQLPTSLLALGKAVFKNCLSLRKLEIPESVMYIPSNTFKGCTALSSVIIPESVEFISSDAFKNTSSCLTLHVVDSSRAMQYAIDNEILYSIVDK